MPDALCEFVMGFTQVLIVAFRKIVSRDNLSEDAFTPTCFYRLVEGFCHVGDELLRLIHRKRNICVPETEQLPGKLIDFNQDLCGNLG